MAQTDQRRQEQPQPSGKEGGISANPGDSFVPRPEDIKKLSLDGINVDLLAFDPAGFVKQLLLPKAAWNAKPERPVSEQLLSAASALLKHLSRDGLPRNPDSEETLKQLFSPAVLRGAISRRLHEGRPHPVLSDLAAICFVLHPDGTLQEFRSLSDVLLVSQRRREIQRELADGLISACKVNPKLWGMLEEQRGVLSTGADTLSALFESHHYAELVELPAFVVEQILRSRELPSPTEARVLPREFSLSFRALIDAPGLFPILRHVRQASGTLSEQYVDYLVDAVKRSIEDPRLLSKWVNRHRKSELVRYDQCADSLLRGFVEELFQFDEVRTALARLGDTPSGVISNIKEQRTQLVAGARSSMQKILSRNESFRERDVDAILGELDRYSEFELKSCVELCKQLLAGGTSSGPLLTGCELAARLASAGVSKPEIVIEAFDDSRGWGGAACGSVLRVVLNSQHPSDVANILAKLARSSKWGELLEHWHLVPDRHEGVLYRAMLHHVTDHDILVDQIVAGAKQSGLISEAEIPEILSLKSRQTNNSNIYNVVASLSKIRVRDEGVAQWRARLIESISALPPYYLHDSSRILEGILYEQCLTEEIRGSQLSEGLRMNVCSLKISSSDAAQLSPQCQKALTEVNRWMNGAFSDHALERTLFTSASVLLEGYGQTKRTLRDLQLSVREAARADQSSQATSTLLKAITEFRVAQTKGYSCEALRRRLVRQGLIQYQEQDTSLMAATEMYLRRHGLRGEDAPLVKFPALILLNRIKPRSYQATSNEPSKAGKAARSILVVRRSKEELAQVVSECRKALESELMPKRSRSPLQLVVGQGGRQGIKRAFAKLLLGVSLAAGAVTTADAMKLPVWGAADAASGYRPTDGSAPNGSIPKVARPVAKLSKAFDNINNSYLLYGLVGSNADSAAQPSLSHEGAAEVYSWLLDDGQGEIEELASLELREVRRDSYVPLPIRARVFDPTRTVSSDWIPAQASRDARSHTVEIAIPREHPIDRSLGAAHVTDALGASQEVLSHPRLHFSKIQQASPELAKAIRAARSMSAAEATEHLREVVMELIAYEETPTYDDFTGTFEEYFKLILANRKGICGQFAVVFDEALKQAGVPSCMVSCILPEKDRTTYTTAGAHLTNIVFLLDSDRRVVPRIVDATGASQMEAMGQDASSSSLGRDESSSELGRLVIPTGLAIGSAGLATILMLRRRRREEPLEVSTLIEIPEEMRPPDESRDSGEASIDSSSLPTPEPSAPRIDRFNLMVDWTTRQDSRKDSQEAQRLSLSEITDSDLDSISEEIEASARRLYEITPEVSEILSRVKEPASETTIAIANSWLARMQDPDYRNRWKQYLKRPDLFTPEQEKALLRLARDVVKPFRDEGRYRLMERLSSLSTPKSIDSECLLRALVPLDVDTGSVGR